MDLTGP